MVSVTFTLGVGAVGQKDHLGPLCPETAAS